MTDTAAEVRPAIIKRLERDDVDVEQCMPLINAFCEAIGEWTDATAAIKKHGLLIETGRGSVKKNPAIEIRKEAAALLIRIGEQLGMTPKAKKLLTGDGATNGGRAKEALESFLDDE